jgi:hypothetical protein
MSSDRAKLVLDEQSFQGLLAAAFTIQEHNARMNSAEPSSPPADVPRQKEAAPPEAQSAPSTCNQCGTPLPAANASCPNCAVPSFRQGERLQRNWASLWQMSQEQGGVLEAHKKPETDLPLSPADPGRPRPNPADSLPAARPAEPAAPFMPPNGHAVPMPEIGIPQRTTFSRGIPAADPRNDEHSLALPPEHAAPDQSLNLHASAIPDASADWNAPASAVLHDATPAESLALRHEAWSGQERTAEARTAETALAESDTAADFDPATEVADPPPGKRSLRHLHRADLYLGFAIVFAIAVLLWPSGGSDQKPSLPPWQRALIAIGIAEAPQPVAHFHGDPDMKVWIDTHTALYYCPGDELYGKSPDGHYSTQREAQADNFEPAERSVCIE